MVIEYLTAILVFITAIYAYLTHRMTKASESSVEAIRNQSEAMFRPYVTVSSFIRPHTPFLYLRIANTGRTGAENLCLGLDRDFFQFGETDRPEKNLRNKSAFTTPMDSFPPDTELTFALGQAWVLFGKEGKMDACPVQFTVTATYEYLGKKIEERHCIDLRGYLGSEGNHDPIVEELERIRKIMEKKN
ncbi:hypothetical protein [Thiovibrio frasassiensis]|uniref:Uncharacterized protein n=1 Tax=Thiovibrio frasassiensis TaxID=2984131 RepID=A0A9X4MJ11_9BACT|nr:hypothetical protein [Thiovibrio frasassiensis]MDG4476413.1 hypothetical protein [Thiovibrio frasassiensis]